jgi:hypothetical protein
MLDPKRYSPRAYCLGDSEQRLSFVKDFCYSAANSVLTLLPRLSANNNDECLSCGSVDLNKVVVVAELTPTEWLTLVHFSYDLGSHDLLPSVVTETAGQKIPTAAERE